MSSETEIAPQDPWLRTDDAAQHLGVSRRWLGELRQTWRWRRFVLVSHWHWFWGSRAQLYGSGKQIQSPPGYRLRTLAEFFCSRRTFELVLEPTLRDLFDEYCEALNEGRRWKARWVRIRGSWSFWRAASAQLAVSFIRLLIQAWTASR